MSEQKKIDDRKSEVTDDSHIPDNKQLETTSKTLKPDDKKNEAQTSDLI